MAAAPVQHAVTQKIWGHSDTLLLVFAAAAAEFAVNRAVDWLFFTGALPRDPIARLFRTVHAAQAIAFADAATAHGALEQIRRIHAAVERARGSSIPPWAHRAVLYMLIDYSERAAVLLDAPLTQDAQHGLYADFRRIGEGLGIRELPPDYASWRSDREHRLIEDLAWSRWTAALYAAYRHHLGPVRYVLLRHLQAALVPPVVRQLLHLPAPPTGARLLAVFRMLRTIGLAPVAKHLVVPPRHWRDLRTLEYSSDATRPAHAH